MGSPMRTSLVWLLLMATPFPAQAVDLSRHRWQHRPLLVFAPDAGHPAYARLEQALAGQRAQLGDRDMRIYRIVDQRVSLEGEPLDDSARTWRQRMGVAAGAFTVILVGKDGGVKLRGGSDTTLGGIFRLIDGMPMRRRQMQQDS